MLSLWYIPELVKLYMVFLMGTSVTLIQRLGDGTSTPRQSLFVLAGFGALAIVSTVVIFIAWSNDLRAAKQVQEIQDRIITGQHEY